MKFSGSNYCSKRKWFRFKNYPIKPPSPLRQRLGRSFPLPPAPSVHVSGCPKSHRVEKNSARGRSRLRFPLHFAKTHTFQVVSWKTKDKKRLRFNAHFWKLLKWGEPFQQCTCTANHPVVPFKWFPIIIFNDTSIKWKKITKTSA